MRFLQPKSNVQLNEHRSCQLFWKMHPGLHFTKELKKKSEQIFHILFKDCEAFV